MRDGGNTGTGGSKDAGSGGSGGAPPLGDASRPFKGRSVVYLPSYRGSFTGWSNALPWAKMTHLILAFAVPSGNTFTVQGNSDPTITQIVNAAHANGVKVLIAIGGANGGSDMIAALYTPGNVDNFVNNLTNWSNGLNFDGVDVDQEGNPVNADYGPFVDKLVAKLRPSGKLITAAVGQWYGDRIPASAYAKFDFVNLMSYDHCGDWTPPCEHASMDWANKDLAFFRAKISNDKIVLGVPFYGYCWGTGCPAKAMTYAEILAKWPGVADYYVNGGITLSYNSAATIITKTQLSKTYGGIMVWEIGQDASGDQSLMKAIGDNL
jgi:GH18 family chitinase